MWQEGRGKRKKMQMQVNRDETRRCARENDITWAEGAFQVLALQAWHAPTCFRELDQCRWQ